MREITVLQVRMQPLPFSLQTVYSHVMKNKKISLALMVETQVCSSHMVAGLPKEPTWYPQVTYFAFISNFLYYWNSLTGFILG